MVRVIIRAMVMVTVMVMVIVRTMYVPYPRNAARRVGAYNTHTPLPPSPPLPFPPLSSPSEYLE